MAVNRRKKVQGQPDADFFRVAAWGGMADSCQKYLTKGRKVAVVGPVSVSTYQAQDGSTRANLEVFAEDVEFLSSSNGGNAGGSSGSGSTGGGNVSTDNAGAAANDPPIDMTPVAPDDLPF